MAKEAAEERAREDAERLRVAQQAEADRAKAAREADEKRAKLEAAQRAAAKAGAEEQQASPSGRIMAVAPATGFESGVVTEMSQERGNARQPEFAGTLARNQEKDIDVDEVLMSLFERVSDIYSFGNNQAKAINFMLDLAMETFPAESASVLLIDTAPGVYELYFAAARGPKAKEVMQFRVPIGAGIAGFCVQEQMGLAVSEVERDPRFYREISQRLGYPTRSILASPVLAEDRIFGVIELINKKNSNAFSPGELSVLNYIAEHTAEYLIRAG